MSTSSKDPGKLTLLCDALRYIARSTDRVGLITGLESWLRGLLDFDRCLVGMLDGRGIRLIPSGSSRTEREGVERVIRSGRLLQEPRAGGKGAILVLPLNVLGRTFGAMLLGTPCEAGYGADDQSLAQAVADSLSLRLGLPRYTGSLTGTERVRSEDALRQSEGQFRGIFHLAAVGMVQLDARTGRFIEANERYQEFTGYTLEELRRMTPLDLDHPDDRGADAALLESFMTREIPEYFNVKRYVRKDGRVIWVEINGSLNLDAHGNPVSAVAVVHDVTEQKRLEEEQRQLQEDLERRVVERTRQLTQAHERLGMALTGANVGLWDWDAVTNATYYSPTIKTQLGYPPDDPWRDFRDWETRLHPDDRAKALRTILDYFEHRTDEYVSLFRLRCPDGSYRWILSQGKGEFDAKGKPLRMMGVHVDITDRKKAEEDLRSAVDELKVAKRKAEAGDRAKGEFLANMSHEIRTPMNAVIGMTELVLDTRLSEVQRDYLGMVKDSAESLLSLINDILDFSKIEAGKLELDDAPFSIRETLGDTMKALALRARHKDLELACHVRPDVPESLVGDPFRLRQIVTNLVGNAIKFTKSGEVVLNVAVETATEDRARIRISVRDTGIGIPKEKQAAIFEAFSQADASTTRRFGGTGLGLAITSELVSLMGGRIWVESEEGEGSTFHFTAELRRPGDVPVKAAAAPESLFGLRTLIVDDNETNRLILLEMVSNWGMSPVAVPGAEEAIAELRRAEDAGAGYGLVLTDVHMPGTDGFELTQRIRATPEFGGTVILMLTSGDSPGDIERCRTVGGAAHLMKPIKQSELFDAIVEATGVACRVNPLTGPVPEEEEMRPLRILLAEDSYPNQRLAVGLLTKWGHEVTVANNGGEAVAELERGRYDLVLMDVQMPKMDGYQATAVIREREQREGGRVPIVAMTAHAMKGDREECLAAGMDGYVAKPIRRDDLRRALEEFAPDTPISEGEGAGGSLSPTPRRSDPPLPGGDLDWGAALNFVGGDDGLLREVLVAMVEECTSCLDQAEKAIAERDARTLRRSAHTVKGNLRIFGESPAADLALALENLGRDQSFDGADGLLGRLRAAAEAPLREVRQYLARGSDTDHRSQGL